MVTARLSSWLRVANPSLSHLKRNWMIALFSLFVLAGCGPWNVAGQTVQFDGTQRPVAFGFYEPMGVAVDQYGNLFVADADTYLISEILAVNGQIPPNPTIRALYRDSSNPAKLTVDKKGNVFFSDEAQTVKEILAVGGSIPASPTVVQLGSGFSFPEGLTVDATGNLYVANGTSVLELLATNGIIPPSPAILSLGSGFSGARGVTVDASGNVYVADSGNHAVKEIVAVNGSIPSSPTILTLASNYCSPDGVSLDAQGNLYFSDYCNAAVYEILAVNGSIPASPVVKMVSSGAGLGGVTDVAVDSNENIYAGGVFDADQVPQVYPADFGSVRIGTTTSATPLMFTFIGSVTVGSVSVVGSDFENAGTGTCAPGTYNSPSGYSLCTVNMTFTPTLAGARSGSVILKDTSGNALATGYVHGTGVAPLVNFAPPVQSAAISNVSGAAGVAVDASANLYIAATSQNQVLKETLSGGSYVQSVIPTSTLNDPRGVAVDAAGNIYIADTGNNRVLKETPSPAGFQEKTVDSGLTPTGVTVDQDGHFDIVYADGSFTGFNIDGYLGTGLSSASGVAVDINHNLYIVSSSTPGSILMETLNGGNYISSTIPLSGIAAPSGISLDRFGNLYVSGTDSNGAGQVVKLTPSQNGYIQSMILTQGLSQPAGLAVDSSGNVFIADSGNSRIVKVDSSDPPSLTFASTPFGATSPDSPQTVTLENVGNAGLILPIPANGNNPGITTNFTLNDNAPSACPVIGSGSPEPGVLAADSSCVLPISFAPTMVGSISGSLALTDNNQNAAAPSYAVQTISLNGTAIPATPSITWPAPAAITYGTALSSAQLDATTSVPGTFGYSPAAGTVLTAGTQTLSVTFTPTDTTDYTSATQTVSLTVNKAVPSITWPSPAAITYGTALSGAQLDATTNIPGTFSYSPAAGTVLTAGTQTLTVTFTPTDTTDYTSATKTVQLTVNKASPVLSWAPPAPIVYGTALGSTQLDAKANVPGTFVYSPAAGTILAVGTSTLNVTFTPSDTVDYTTAVDSVQLTVNPAPGFSLSATPSSISIKQGSNGTSTIAVNATGGFSGSVTLSASGLPKGVTATFSPNPITTSGLLSFLVSNGASTSTSTVTVTGKSGSLVQTATITLTVAHK